MNGPNGKGFNMSRTIQSINSGWDFHLGDPAGHTSGWEGVDLPHCWNARDLPAAGTDLRGKDEGGTGVFAGYGTSSGQDYYRGLCHYRRRLGALDVRGGRRHYLKFEGANQDAVVWLNGRALATHLGGYTAFTVDLTGALDPATANLLEVHLSNAHNESVPPVGGDLGHFGGIYRPVWLIATGPVHFDLNHFGSNGVFWQTPEVTPERALLKLTARLVNHSQASRAAVWSIELRGPNGQTMTSQRSETVLPGGGSPVVLELETEVHSPALWSPEQPNLYRLHHQLLDPQTGEVLDEVDSPVGFRFFRIDAEAGFFLNGAHYFLRGVGRHQDYAGLGYAVPETILRSDTRAIRSMGANAMRSHYPLADAIYEECDRAGLIVWAKIPVMDRMTESPAFFANAKTMMRELILQVGQHPSVVFWGYHCEILGDADWFWPKPQDPVRLRAHFAEARRFCQELEVCIKETDPARLTCNDFHTDPHAEWYPEAGLTEVNDINSWNLYQGWYHGHLGTVREWLEKTRAYAPHRPYLLAEFGAGVDERLHAHEPTIYDMSPEWADRFHQTYQAAIRDLPWLAGLFIWTWSDFQRTSLGDCMKHINNKGMVTNDRRPKDAYHQYRAWWSPEPMVRIAGHARTRRIGLAEAGGKLAETIRVYTNVSQVELILDGRSMGHRHAENGAAEWRVEFAAGRHRLEACAGDASDWLDLEVDLFPANLREWRRRDQELCLNVGQSRLTYTDPLTGRAWLPDRPYSPGSYGHVGGRYYRRWAAMAAWDGIRDGVNAHIRGTEDQPVFQTFLIGLEAYRADLPPGQYAVGLCFCEPFTEEMRRHSDLSHGADRDGGRVFDVSINGQPVLASLDLAGRHGPRRAVTELRQVQVGEKDGLTVAFRGVRGEPILNGLIIRPLSFF